MTQSPYHHGNLRDELIQEGLHLLNQVGIDSFSLRKVASLCGVSHTAPYKHFKNKEELIVAISEKVQADFAHSFHQVIHTFHDPCQQTIEIGKQYVRFMVEHPEYTKFLFSSGVIPPIPFENQQFRHSENLPFELFKESAFRMFKQRNIPESQHHINILSMWSMVHGYAMLLVKQTVVLDVSYTETIEQILISKFSL